LGGAILGSIIALYLTLVAGRVLWVRDIKQKKVDFDIKDNS
jgi:hypothetical protein